EQNYGGFRWSYPLARLAADGALTWDESAPYADLAGRGALAAWSSAGDRARAMDTHAESPVGTRIRKAYGFRERFPHADHDAVGGGRIAGRRRTFLRQAAPGIALPEPSGAAGHPRRAGRRRAGVDRKISRLSRRARHRNRAVLSRRANGVADVGGGRSPDRLLPPSG